MKRSPNGSAQTPRLLRFEDEVLEAAISAARAKGQTFSYWVNELIKRSLRASGQLAADALAPREEKAK